MAIFRKAKPNPAPAPSTTAKIAELRATRQSLTKTILRLEADGAKRERQPVANSLQARVHVLLGEEGPPPPRSADLLADALDEREAVDLALEILGRREQAERSE